MSGRLTEIKWSVCIPKFQRILCVLFSRTDSRLCKNHLFVWSNFSFLHNSQLITLPTQSCLLLLTFCAIIIIIFIISFYYYPRTWEFFIPDPIGCFSHLLKSPRLFFNIPVDFSHFVVWMASILYLFFSSSIHFSRFLATVPENLTTIGITVTSCPTTFQLSVKLLVFVKLFAILNFHSVVCGNDKIYSMTRFFSYCKLKLGLIFLFGLGDQFVLNNSVLS